MPGPTFNASTRKFAIASAIATASIAVLYAAVLIAGLMTLKSAEQPIGDPLFSVLELLIILMMPALVGTMVAIHAWASVDAKSFSLMALVFMSLLAGLTGSLHFVILTLSRLPAFSDPSWTLVFSFSWPSVAYAVDILAWDVFFPLSALFAAAVFNTGPLERTIRALLVASAILALAGLSGVAFSDMRLRNIGIVGYAGTFPLAALLLACLFYRARVPPDVPAATNSSDADDRRPGT